MEDHYPGLWQTWFLQQTAAVGWPPRQYPIDKPTKSSAWRSARKSLRQVAIGDKIIVQLRNYHVGRVGTVTGVRIEDNEWDATVPRTARQPQGEMGRRIEVRWDMTVGPIDPAAIAKLPESLHPKGGVWRRTIARMSDAMARSIEGALERDENWTTLQANFASERAISEYIGAFPHRLEDGMRTYPNAKVREHVFPDKKRTDVLLLDRDDHLVVVECKQGAPTVENIAQLRGYMSRAKSLVGPSSVGAIRGMLVHGGALKLNEAVRQNALKRPTIELVRFSVGVDFMSSR